MLRKRVSGVASLLAEAGLLPLARCIPFEALAGIDAYRAKTPARIMSAPRVEFFGLHASGRVLRSVSLHGPWVDVASSFRTFIAKIALFVEVGQCPSLVLRTYPRTGERLATFFKATRIDEASDAVNSFWRTEHAVIQDGSADGNDPACTSVWARNSFGVAEAFAALAPASGVSADLFVGATEPQKFVPSAAPSLPISLVTASAHIPLRKRASDGRLIEGVVLVERRSNATPMLHRIRTAAGRVVEWDAAECAWAPSTADDVPPPSRRRFMLATESLAGAVSDRCLRWLASTSAERDPADVLPSAELEAALAERGVVVPTPLLEFEELAGGLWLRGRRSGERYALGVAIQLRLGWRPNKEQVPIGVTHDTGEYRMDARGHVVADDDVSVCEPVASSWRTLLERLAIGHDYPDPYAPWGHVHLELKSDIAEAIASRLQARRIQEVSDEYESFWESGNSVIWRTPRYAVNERRLVDTVVDTGTVVEAVRILRAAHAVSPGTGVWVHGKASRVGPDPLPAETERIPFDSRLARPGESGAVLVRGDRCIEQRVAGRDCEIFWDDI